MMISTFNSPIKRTQTILSHLVSASTLADIGVIGLAVMGENLVLNMASKGFTVSCWNRTLSKVDDFINGRAKGKTILGHHDIPNFVKSVKRPRKIMIMVRAGIFVDEVIERLLPYLEKDDILIDGGNSNYVDTNKRIIALKEKGIMFLGAGVSGGEEGALKGPSIMPGGTPEAWNHVKPIFQKISAQVLDNGVLTPCCDYVGEDGSGHFVKMVHNGIEYGDMQLLAEGYHILKSYLHLSNSEIADVFSEWNTGILDSYLVETTAEIFRKTDESGKYVIDLILDTAGQKGTGKWTVENALELGVPVTLVSEAVFARILSTQKERRVQTAALYNQASRPGVSISPEDRKKFITALRDAVYASKIISYAQGFDLLRQAALHYKWNLNYSSIALMWRGGCIIRSKFLIKISEAYRKKGNLENLILDSFFKTSLDAAESGWRQVVSVSANSAIAIPAISSALSYFDGLCTAASPANLLQAIRDYFGAHTYERVDQPRGKFFHTNWTGRGGSTASSAYTA